MKKKILKTLRELGFAPKTIDADLYEFTFEDQRYIYCPLKEDDDFLAFGTSTDFTEDDPIRAMYLAQQVNARKKYVKAYMFQSRLFLSYERQLIGNEDLRQVVGQMIVRMFEAFVSLKDFNDEYDKEFANDDDDDTIEDK